ncbi:core-2/I-branching enzyme-domain-containing protein [Pavlovales sp. CCMP2436]|nr:core-2/I-branching enzyme-domain-containing protein [Pavlovales sp. CCMP2436]
MRGALLLLAAAYAGARAREYVDHRDSPVDGSLAAVVAGCDASIAELLAREAEGVAPFEAAADAIEGAPSSKDERGLSIAYLVMAGRTFAHYTVTRLVRATYSPHNLYLIHLDAKLGEETTALMRAALAPHSNIHFHSRRHRVGWGGFSMVAVLLDAIATAVGTGCNYDFFINLSDSDMALRTHAEISAFLAGFRDTSFVAVKDPARDWMRYRSHAHMRRLPFIECAGLGFAVLNATADSLFGEGRAACCLARSGPIIYTTAPLAPPHMPEDVEVFHGSQWAILARPFFKYLALAAPGVAAAARGAGEDEAAAAATEAAAARVRALVSAFRFGYMSDEAFLQTAILDSPFCTQLVSHNVRYIDWPGGQTGLSYWQRMGIAYASGPRVLDSGSLELLRTSEAMFARKVDPSIDSVLIANWDVLMTAKHQGEHPPDQPLIAYSLLRQDATLGQLRAPLTRAEREGGAEAVEPHALHYGSEDVLEDLHALEAMQPQQAQGDTAAGGARPAEVWQVAYVTFVDGSICHCASTCRRRGVACCNEHIQGCTHSGDATLRGIHPRGALTAADE